MNKKILFVDDEYDIISAFKRNLRSEFVVATAMSAEEALQIINDTSDIAVIVTDYRMPKTNGIQLLEKVREIEPDIIRIMLTGHADLHTAINSVNKGNIFRFLTKPIRPNELSDILKEALELYRLKKSEQELLNDTFKGVINVFIELMQQTHPEAFNHTRRIRNLGKDIANELEVAVNWEFEISFLLSKIGLIMIPPSVVESYFSGQTLQKNENKLFESYPELGFSILNKIPRLENIAENIKHQNLKFDGSNCFDIKLQGEQIPFVSRVLKVVNDFDRILQFKKNIEEAIYKLQENSKFYDPDVLSSLSTVVLKKKRNNPVVSVKFTQLRIGMLLVRDIRDRSGALLLKKGTEITDILLMRLYHASKVREIQEPILVIEPYK